MQWIRRYVFNTFLILMKITIPEEYRISIGDDHYHLIHVLFLLRKSTEELPCIASNVDWIPLEEMVQKIPQFLPSLQNVKNFILHKKKQNPITKDEKTIFLLFLYKSYNKPRGFDA